MKKNVVEANPFIVGDQVSYRADDPHSGRTPFPSTWGVKPGGEYTVDRIKQDMYLYHPDGAGGFHWKCYEKIKDRKQQRIKIPKQEIREKEVLLLPASRALMTACGIVRIHNISRIDPHSNIMVLVCGLNWIGRREEFDINKISPTPLILNHHYWKNEEQLFWVSQNDFLSIKYYQTGLSMSYKDVDYRKINTNSSLFSLFSQALWELVPTADLFRLGRN